MIASVHLLAVYVAAIYLANANVPDPYLPMSTYDMETVFSLKKALRKATTATLKQLDQAQVQRQCESTRVALSSHFWADNGNL